MNTADFIKRVQWLVAELAVGASSLRNQGGSGLVLAAREHFKNINLNNYGSVRDQKEFDVLLGSDTRRLIEDFKLCFDAHHFGPARKAMNLFLRDSGYNRFLSCHYGLGRIEPWLEAPLDNDVAAGLLKDIANKTIIMPEEFTAPVWTSIKSLKEPKSKGFQRIAQVRADSEHIARIHVDLLYFRRTERQ